MSYEKLAKQPIDTQMRAAHGILKTIERHLKIEENEQFLMERSAAVKKVNVSSVEKSPTVELFDAEKTLLITENGKVDTRRKCLVSLLDKGSKTPLAVISKGLMNRLTRLGETFPNFEAVVRYYKETLVLESMSSPAVIKLPPVLLVGMPGVGKTRFLSELAGVMKTDFYSIDMSTVSAGFVLTGSSSTWSEGKSEFVSQSLIGSEVANPIVLIDEIDKASSDARYDPLGFFYSLLERHTARRFVDESLDIELDCSHIIWVASANYIEKIPEPIRTRMEVFVIEPPSDKQTGVIFTKYLPGNVERKHMGPILFA